MSKFNINKGGKFQVDKGIQHVRLGLGWDESRLSKPIDVDAHAFGVVMRGGVPRFYGDASHALTYANSDLKLPNGSFATSDGSMHHSGDNRTGSGSGDDETIKIKFDLLPDEITEIMVFITIHEAKKRGQHFGLVDGSYVVLYNDDTGEELCRYNLKQEFDGLISIQVGSLVKENDKWSFNAVGAGSRDEGLQDLLEKLS